MLLSAYLKIVRCSTAFKSVEGLASLGYSQSFASAAGGKNKPRWYKEVKVTPDAEQKEFLITLDRRPLKTPGRNTISLPSYPLALAVAAEWQRQEWKIRPFTMPLMTITSTAIDEPKARDQVIKTLLRYLHTDVLTCLHESDEELIEEQKKLYSPIIEWASEQLGTALTSDNSVFGAEQSDEAVSALRKFLEGLDKFELAGVDSAASNCKSILLALALFKGRLGVRDAVSMARVEDNMQLEHWGYVEGGHDIDEADSKIRILAASIFLRLLKIST